MKIAVIGSSGLLGEGHLHIASKSKHEFITTYFNKNVYPQTIFLDIRYQDKVSEFLSKYEPDVVINTAAITNPELCDKDHDNAHKTNVIGTKNLAYECNQRGIHLILLSTEYVFDGKRGSYRENDPPSPISYYGKTKFEAEKITLETNPNFCIARTAMLFGWSKTKQNLATYLISNLRNNKKVDVIYDQIVSPSYNNNIAEMLNEIAEKKLGGIYHISGSSIVTRYEFALTVAKIFQLDESLVGKISISNMGWKTKRPLNGGLIVEKAQKTLSTKPLDIEQSLRQMKDDEKFIEN